MELQSSKHFHLSFTKGLSFLARGTEAHAIAHKIPNSRVWNSKSFSNMGLVGIDGQVLWIFANPAHAQAPVFKIALPETVTLLYDFLELTPSDASGSIENDLKKEKHPFGACDLCNQPFWPQPGQYGPRLVCPKHSHQGRKLTTQDATKFAQFMKSVCPECKSSMHGAKNGANGTVFLRCSRSGCSGIKYLRDLI